MSKYVLDASAIIALLVQEPGKERVAEVIGESCVSAVNLSEVIVKLAQEGMPEPEIHSVVKLLQIQVMDFDIHAAWATARLRPLTRQVGLSLGDRACLGLALQLRLPAMTADRVWALLEIRVPIELIR